MSETRGVMFNQRASDPKSKPDMVVRSLGIRTGDVVADIGAGGGYFTMRFAAKVGIQGSVYAVDVNPDFLEFIREECVKQGVVNVETVPAAAIGDVLPERGLDLIFLRNVYHHLPDRTNYFRGVEKFLKREGRVAIVEYKRGKLLSFHRLFGHHVPPQVIVEELAAAGYRVVQSFDFLPEQSFTIFAAGKGLW